MCATLTHPLVCALVWLPLLGIGPAGALCVLHYIIAPLPYLYGGN